MCSDTVSALTVTGLGKVYRIYNRPMDRIRELYSIRGRKYHHEFTALENISFEVFQGETIGVIGPNGSGILGNLLTTLSVPIPVGCT